LPEPEPVSYTIRYTAGEAEDRETTRLKAAAIEVRRNLSALARDLTDSQLRPIIAAWDADDLERVRDGLEAVDRLKAAMAARANVVPFPQLADLNPDADDD
jgi:hypothetical protein